MTHLVEPGTRMTVAEYEALKAKPDKTDHDYILLHWFEEEFYNKSSKLAADFKATQLLKLLKQYEDYIEDAASVYAIYAKVNKLAYHKGELVTTDKWPHRNHTVTVNGIELEFHTGTGLNYSRSKVIFNTIDSVLHDCMDAESYTLEEFLKEFCYLNSGESAMHGIRVYQDMQAERRKALQIWKHKEIENYCASVNL